MRSIQCSILPDRYLILIRELLSSVDQMEDALKKRKQRAAKG
jgi:hypothetical protein